MVGSESGIRDKHPGSATLLVSVLPISVYSERRNRTGSGILLFSNSICVTV
jgi:hypothetical protein